MNRHLLPHNATTLEKAISETLDRVTETPNPLKVIYDADNCPEHLLPYLAWAVSVDFWDNDFTVAQKRLSIKNAFAQHITKGTVGAIKNALAVLGISSIIREWFEYGGGVHEFILDIQLHEMVGAGVILDDVLYQKARNALAATKPLRSHGITQMTLNSENVIDFHAVADVLPYVKNDYVSSPQRDFVGAIDYAAVADILPYVQNDYVCSEQRDFTGILTAYGMMKAMNFCHLTMEAQ
jgi:phage tail P2-like protein